MEKEGDLLFGQEVREKLCQGFEIAALSVKNIFGSPARSSLIDKKKAPPESRQKGYKTLSTLILEEAEKNAGLQLVKEAARKVEAEVGDGTTATILLAYALVIEMNRYIASGHDPLALKRSVEEAKDYLLSALKRQILPVKSQEEISHIASIGGGGSKEIGRYIAKALEETRGEGLVIIEEGTEEATKISKGEGIKIERGIFSPYFGSGQEKSDAVVSSPRILVTDHKISSPQEILTVLQEVMASGEALFIIADDIEGEALATLIMNKMHSSLVVYAIKAPSFGKERARLLEEIAMVTGATFIAQERGIDLKIVDRSYLGYADKIFMGKEETLILGGRGEKKKIEERRNFLKDSLEKTTLLSEKESLSKRIAYLPRGFCRIVVGAENERERKEKRARFEESLRMTLVALKEGMVIGGGAGLLLAAHSIEEKSVPASGIAGLTILKKACIQLVKALIDNLGIEPSYMIEEILERGRPFGFNTATGKVEDLLAIGIIDAYKVVSSSIEHAVSAAGIAILSEAMVVDRRGDEHVS